MNYNSLKNSFSNTENSFYRGKVIHDFIRVADINKKAYGFFYV